jgi:hypothetical protein
MHVIEIATLAVLTLTFGAIVWYSWETRKLRELTEKQVRTASSQTSAMFEQVHASREQIALMRAQIDAATLPCLSLAYRDGALAVVNIGAGPALNIRCQVLSHKIPESFFLPSLSPNQENRTGYTVNVVHEFIMEYDSIAATPFHSRVRIRKGEFASPFEWGPGPAPPP